MVCTKLRLPMNPLASRAISSKFRGCSVLSERAPETMLMDKGPCWLTTPTAKGSMALNDAVDSPRLGTDHRRPLRTASVRRPTSDPRTCHRQRHYGARRSDATVGRIGARLELRQHRRPGRPGALERSSPTRPERPSVGYEGRAARSNDGEFAEEKESSSAALLPLPTG